MVAISLIENLLSTTKSVKHDYKSTTLSGMVLQPLEVTPPLKELSNLIGDAIYHMTIFGMFGAAKAMTLYIIVLERLKRNCDDTKMYNLYNAVVTVFEIVKKLLEKEMELYDESEKLLKFSSDKVLTLIEILREFKARSKQEFCSIIFVDRRFTAKILYHILKVLTETEEFNYIKPNFMVGYQNNPYNPTREGLYIAKQNRKVVASFLAKEENLIISTNVLEEGIDIPNCSLVVKFDKPANYRSYVQSKGRARHCQSFYYIMVAAHDLPGFKKITACIKKLKVS